MQCRANSGGRSLETTAPGHDPSLGAIQVGSKAALPGRHIEMPILASFAMLLSLSCSAAPKPLPLTASIEGKGVVRSVGNFVLIGLDAAGDEGGLDGNLDYAFLCEVPSADAIEVSAPSGIQPLRIEMDKSLGQLRLQADESLSLNFHVPRFSKTAPDGSLSAKAIYYRNSDSREDVETAAAELLEEIREANQVFTASDCQAGGFGAGACNTRACGVISGEGFWSCCHQDGEGLCHVVTDSGGSPSSGR
jgi:hypothetical protein